MNTLAGFAGAYGGLFSSTVIVVMLILEVARPGGQRFAKALVAEIVASSVSFGIYFAIAGAVFLDAYQVPQYTFEDWQLLAGIPLGLFAAVVVTLLVGFIDGGGAAVRPAEAPGHRETTLGGVVFGIVGVALPLTMFTGSDQLKTVLDDAGTLGVGLLVALVIAKHAHLRGEPGQRIRRRAHLPGAVHRRNRRGPRPRGDPRRAAGTGVHLPARRRPGALAAAPFSMVLLAAFLTQVGALQTAPILIAVVTAFLTMEGVKYLLARRKQARAAAAKPAAPA